MDINEGLHLSKASITYRVKISLLIMHALYVYWPEKSFGKQQ
ncbi:hypothetical protein [cyanobacterium endosymbiont of Rhopalodia gibberula]|nr:hypothetical protein [cyanobacterium endosymbiont of Rhopalodia gibberula]